MIAVVGTRLAANADRLADRTGLGEALTGGVLLGATTSISGSVLSVTAAAHGRPELAMGNALGGIAAQTAFLAVADAFYRRGNLEHAAASVANILQAALLVCLLSILLVGPRLPDVVLWGVHPVTIVLLGGYVAGMTLVRGAQDAPMWQPEKTPDTRLDQPDDVSKRARLLPLSAEFAAQVAAIGLAGWLLEAATATLVTETPLTESVAGLLLTSTATSLPELVTTIAAVRRGALTLAVSGIVGGNVFDTLFAAFSDVAYRDGSIYHAMSGTVSLWIGVSTLMTGVLLMGLIARQKQGPWRVGFESVLILALYAALVAHALLS